MIKGKLTRAEIQAKIKELLAQIEEYRAQLSTIKSNRVKLFDAAVASIGIDASPNDVAPDEVGCAETVNAIFKSVFGREAGGGLSTHQMYNAMLKDSRFIKVDQALPGDIIISPTGYGNGGLSNGHVGIVGESETIMSNSSATGTFESNYTLKTWVARYRGKGGYPIVFFRVI
jgi:hypothetical protein